jgi:PAS domain S-box-containing protein
MSTLLRCFALFLLATVAGAHAGQHVRVAVFHNPPLMTYDAERHRVSGIFIDVLRHTAAKEGWDVEYVLGTPSQWAERLETGEVDLVAGIPHSKRREERVTFSRETVVTSWGRIYVKPTSTVRTVRDLSGKRVAVLRGSVLRETFQQGTEDGTPASFIEFADFSQAFRAVAEGRADAAMANRFTGTEYARSTGLRATSAVLAPYGFRYAAQRGAGKEHLLDALDRGLLLLKTDSESVYYRDVQKLEDDAREFQIPLWVYWGGAAGLVLVVIGFGWALTLRRAAARVARGECELRRLNEKLCRISENSLDLIAVFDANSVVRHVNAAAQALLGRAPADLVGKSALDWLPPERREASQRVLESVRAGVPRQGHPSQVLRADGTVVPVLWSLVWCEEVQELYAIGHDDTERHELIQRLSRRTEQLQVVNRDLQTFAQSVSHDLRAPLAAVGGFVGKVLRDEAGALQDRSRDLLARARDASQRMDGIITNLLRLARVTEGGIHRRDCDVTAMCHDVLTALQNGDPGRAVAVQIQPGMRAVADRELLRHVVDNLLANAWKFTSRKPGAQVSVACEEGPHGPVFFVRDDGAGFEPDHAQNLFLPFARLHSKTEFDGVGIGLCIAHRVVTAHGGTISAEGSPGAGATFRFTLGDPTDHVACGGPRLVTQKADGASVLQHVTASA